MEGVEELLGVHGGRTREENVQDELPVAARGDERAAKSRRKPHTRATGPGHRGCRQGHVVG